MPYKVNPTTGQLDYYEVSEGGGGGGATNLSFIASPTIGTVTSDAGTDADITLATTTNSGLFSPEEKIKLGIALISVGVNYRDTYNNGADYAIGDVVLYDGKLYERISNPNNPGYPPGTASWGLYDVDLGSPSFDLWIRGVLANKVDTEVGKGLSTEDYTTAEQTKLAGIAAGAEVNVNADWNATSGDAQILNKPSIPAAQVNSDWNAISGVEQILNKPTSLPTANVKHSVKYAEALTKGQAVYVSGADGTNMLVSKASNSTEATSSKTLGLVTASGAANYQGEVITEGLLAGLNTSSATVGDAVWLGTAGNLIFWHYGLTTKPVAPDHLVFIGVVTRVNANNGEIFVKPQNGFEIDELHDVSVVGRVDNSLLGYVSSTGLHAFKTVASWLGYTPANKAGETFTGAIAATNLSGTNTGDNAVNTLYSGLAASKQDAITLTTTGTSGAATLSGNTLNIPQYTGGGGAGSQTLAQTLTLGNSAGTTNLDMNNNDITNIDNVSTSSTTLQLQSVLNSALIFYANNC